MAETKPVTGERRRAYQGPALFCHGFRPFFLFAALFAALAIPIWMAAYSHGYTFGVNGDPLGWHLHEMVFGYLAGVIAGFLMTTIPNWTGRPPVMGLPLILLFLLWLAARVMVFIGGASVFGAVVDSLFLVCMAGFAWREVVAGKNWRNVPICVLISLFALANILFHAEDALGLSHQTGLRLGLAIVTLLMMFIGGRIIPSFTINWMKKRGLTPFPPALNRFDIAVLLLTAVTLFFWIMSPADQLTGILFLVAAPLHVARLSRWKGWRTIAEPMVLILHIAYAWIPLAFLLMGLAIISPTTLTTAHALHVLTAGAMGQLTLAVMTRASLGHCGREITAGRGTIIMYGLVFVGALLRVIFPFTSLDYALAMSIAGVIWASGFLLFAIVYGPMLLAPRR